MIVNSDEDRCKINSSWCECPDQHPRLPVADVQGSVECCQHILVEKD